MVVRLELLISVFRSGPLPVHIMASMSSSWLGVLESDPLTRSLPAFKSASVEWTLKVLCPSQSVISVYRLHIVLVAVLVRLTLDLLRSSGLPLGPLIWPLVASSAFSAPLSL